LPQSFQCAAPCDDLIEHVVDCLLLTSGGLERAEVFEVSKEREHNLRAHVRDHYFAHHQAQALDGAHPARTAVADKPCGLVVPFFEEKIDRVLKRARSPVIVFGRDENKGVKGRNLRSPGFCVLLRVLTLRRRNGFVKKRQVEFFDVHQLELRIGALLRDLVNPLRHSLAITIRARAAENYPYPDHCSLCSCRKSLDSEAYADSCCSDK